MLVDLTQVAAADGLRLDGAIHAAQRSTVENARADAIICLHGTGSNFYSSALFQRLTPRWLELGLQVLWANTRGHDGLSTAATNTGRRRQGAALEIFRESPLDIQAWVECLVARGAQRVLLCGHSSGAVKAIYSLANTTVPNSPHPAIVGLIAISPPRLSHSFFAQSNRKSEFLDTFRRAELLVQAGEGHSLLDIQFPLSMVISAAGFLEKYGPAEPYNVLRHLPQVNCPALLTFGSVEVEREVAFQRLPEEVSAIATTKQDWQVQVIEGADHIYTNRSAELASVIEPWLLSQSQ